MTLQELIDTAIEKQKEIPRIFNEIISAAKTLEEFRSLFAKRAQAGDLDDLYHSIKTIEQARVSFIQNG